MKSQISTIKDEATLKALKDINMIQMSTMDLYSIASFPHTNDKYRIDWDEPKILHMRSHVSKAIFENQVTFRKIEISDAFTQTDEYDIQLTGSSSIDSLGLEQL